MNQTLKQIEEEFEKEHWVKILNEYGSLHKKDAKAFLTQSNLRVIEKVKEILKKHRGIYGMGNIDDVYLELSTLIEQK